MKTKSNIEQINAIKKYLRCSLSTNSNKNILVLNNVKEMMNNIGLTNYDSPFFNTNIENYCFKIPRLEYSKIYSNNYSWGRQLVEIWKFIGVMNIGVLRFSQKLSIYESHIMFCGFQSSCEIAAYAYKSLLHYACIIRREFWSRHAKNLTNGIGLNFLKNRSKFLYPVGTIQECADSYCLAWLDEINKGLNRSKYLSSDLHYKLLNYLNSLNSSPNCY